MWPFKKKPSTLKINHKLDDIQVEIYIIDAFIKFLKNHVEFNIPYRGTFYAVYRNATLKKLGVNKKTKVLILLALRKNRDLFTKM